MDLPELNEGEIYAGLILDAEGKPQHHLVLLPGDTGDLSWKMAKALAETAGGELPTRQEQALLFANCKKHLKPAWYWSSTQHASGSSYAWCQDFHYGDQDYTNAGIKLRARAVRRSAI